MTILKVIIYYRLEKNFNRHIDCCICTSTILIHSALSASRKKKEEIAEQKYVGDSTCKSCHMAEYKKWLTSDHFKALQLPNDSSIVGNFNNTDFVADGVHSSFFKKDGKFMIRTKEGNEKPQDYEVAYAFGYYPLQQYLVKFPGGKLQSTRLSWDSKNKKWFHQYAGNKIDPNDWLHWTKNAQNWNTMCAECHSTNLQKKYDIATDTYHTTFDVMNVSCESCHGPGKRHIDYVSKKDYTQGTKVAGSFLKTVTAQQLQINACTPCHAVKSGISEDKLNTSELLDDYIPVVPNKENFYADGQIKDEVYIYASFLQSKMFHRGVTCTNCHDPHSGKRLFDGNKLCTQCHQQKYDSPAHHFHEANTAGASCVSCHMPGKVYMGNDYRHDHSLRIPRPDQSVAYNTPNACIGCHNNKTNQWAANTIKKWYGPTRKYHFSDDLLPGSENKPGRETHLIKLLGDTAVPSIIKATAANYLGQVNNSGSLKALLQSLASTDAQIRYEALRSLQNFPSEYWIEVASPLLNDKVRAVRIAAADLLVNIPDVNLPAKYIAERKSAQAQLEKYLLYQADFAHGNIGIAQYYERTGNLPESEKFYKRAIQKDTFANLARINLAIVYSEQHKNSEAIHTLLSATKIDPVNPEIYYRLALLYTELKDQKQALTYFEQAVKYKSINPRLYYNYGLLLNQQKQNIKAVAILQKGLSYEPENTDLLYALTFVHFKNGQQAQAKQYAIKLKNLVPDNPNYQALLKALEIKYH